MVWRFIRMGRFEISAFLAGTVYFVATVTYTYVEGQVLHAYFSSWLRSPFCLRSGQWAKLSSCAFRSAGVGVLAVFSPQLYRLSVTIRL